MSRPFPAKSEEVGSYRAVPGADHDLAHAAGNASAVSWGAILAGAAAAAALSLVLLMLGVGLGLSSVSPWAMDGVSATTFGTSTVVWITVTQLAASAFGGYLAGRLRTRWASTDTDEVYFRDTAHGFLAWAIASLATVTLLASAVGSIVNGGAQVVGTAASTGAQLVGKADSSDTSTGYFVDSLFRTEGGAAVASPAVEPISSAQLSEVGRIFATNMQATTLPAADTRHIGQLVAQHTGLPQAEAENRVNTVYGQMQSQLQTAKATALDAVEKSRMVSASAALWLFVALLMGAFVASWVATYGGRRRDM